MVIYIMGYMYIYIYKYDDDDDDDDDVPFGDLT